MAIATTEEYKVDRGITETTWDFRIGNWIRAAEAQILRYCGRTSFDEATYTHVFNGEGGTSLQLDVWPVTSITSVKLVAPDGTMTTLPSTSYKVEGETGILSRIPLTSGRNVTLDEALLPEVVYGDRPDFSWGWQNYQVIYVAGYDSDDMPYDLKEVLFKLVDALFAANRNGSIVATGPFKSESVGKHSYTRFSPEELLVQNEAILAPFRRGMY